MTASVWKKRALRFLAAAVAVAALVAAADYAWTEQYVKPRVERFPDPIALASQAGPSPQDHHYEIAFDLISELRSGDFSAPRLAEAARALEGNFGARADSRARHVLARLITLGSSSNFRRTQRAIHLPTPASVSFVIEVPPGAVLRGDVGILPKSPAPADFEIQVDGETAWRGTQEPMKPFRYDTDGWFYKNIYRYWNVALSDREARWTPFEVDLSKWAGKKVKLAVAAKSSSDKSVQAFVGAPVVLAKRPGPPRQVVLYLADACGVEHLGAYGSKDGLTPNIDAFALQGALIESFISSGNWSRPGSTCMLTGRSAPRLHLPLAPSHRKINPAVRELFEGTGIDTAATLYRSAGYRTVAVLNNIFVDPSTRVGVDLGFDSLTQTMRADLSTADVEYFTASALSAHRDENILLYIHQNAPNPADEPPTKFRRIARPAWKDREYGRLRYLASLAYADFTFGRFLKMIDAAGWNRALIFFSADHGQVLSNAHEIRTPDKPDDMRRALYFHGQTLYEEELRVPFIVRGPEISAGLRVPGQYSSRVVLPTLLRLNGMAVPPAMEGRDLSAVFTDKAPPGEGERVVSSHGKYAASIRVDDRYKYIRWTVPRRMIRAGSAWKLAAVREELFDLQKDPGETTNLAGVDSNLLGLMRRTFDREVPRFEKLWGLRVPKGAADEIIVVGAARVLSATEGTVTGANAAEYRIKLSEETRLGIFPDAEASELKVTLLKNGVPLTRDRLHYGPAFTRPENPEGYAINLRAITPDAPAELLSPDPEGPDFPHLCLMALDDWIAETPETGSMESAVKDLLKQWGYVQ